MTAHLRTEPDEARKCCWCGGWGHFYNTAYDPPELMFCGNCEDAAKDDDPFAGKSELEQDLMLARLGDYPGPDGCKRIAAAYDALAAQGTEAQRAETLQDGSVHDGPVAKRCAQTPSTQSNGVAR
jgi:hypothetical protein